MSNLLYTITAYPNSISGASPSVEGIGCTTQFNVASQQYEQSSVGTITSNTVLIGSCANGSGVNSGIFNRCETGTGGIGVGDGYFGLILVNLAFTDIANAEAQIGTSQEFDWVGTPKSLTFHHPSQTEDVYTVIVPSDEVVYQTTSARVGNVLVWHVPAGELGLYGQNINLPFQTSPVTSVDTDTKAAERMLDVGYGIIASGVSFFNQSW